MAQGQLRARRAQATTSLPSAALPGAAEESPPPLEAARPHRASSSRGPRLGVNTVAGDARAHEVCGGEGPANGEAFVMELPKLMEEALSLCEYLSPEELAQLSCAASWRAPGEERHALWRAYFVFRWGMAHGVTRRTEVRVMRSWVDEELPAPWPLAIGFCGARSALDHLFWCMPVVRYFLRADLAPQTALPPQPPPPLCWQFVCRMRAQPRGAARCRRCIVCDVIEVTPLGHAPQHFRRRWTRPCGCSPVYAHRACLERCLLQDSTAVGLVQLRRFFDRSPSSAAADGSGPAVYSDQLKCNACGHAFRIVGRFPDNLLELIAATLQEWRWLVRRLLVMLVFFAWMMTLASHYRGSQMSHELTFLLLLTACMMSISLSQRFHCGVQKIWHTPFRWRYFKLFGLFALQNYLISLRAVEPSLWMTTGIMGAPASWLRMLNQVHLALNSSCLGTVVLSLMSLLHIITTSGVIFLFWKTSLRVPTVADVEVTTQAQQTGDCGASYRGHYECGLCELGLCLDNTYM